MHGNAARSWGSHFVGANGAKLGTADLHLSNFVILVFEHLDGFNLMMLVTRLCTLIILGAAVFVMIYILSFVLKRKWLVLRASKHAYAY